MYTVMPDTAQYDDSTDAYWLGLTFDPITKQVMSTQNRMLVHFSNWDNYEPNPSAGLCIAINRNLKWFSMNCQSTAMAICQVGKNYNFVYTSEIIFILFVWYPV